MKISEERLQDLFSYLGDLSRVRVDEIPDIDSCMDQVTTFMDGHSEDMRRHPGDKALIKTMINNYTKNNLLPSPVKKKYSKDYTLMPVFIYYFRNLLSFSDIEELFRPITSKHFPGQTSQLSLEDIYNEVFISEKDEMNNLKSDMAAKFAHVQDTSSDAPVDDKDGEYLKPFVFICEPSLDVHLKIQMIEMIAGQFREDALALHKK